MYDLFWDEINDSIVVNVYADEVQSRECPYTKHLWHYIGIVIERLDNPLLQDIIDARFRNNFDETSPYFSKNNQTVHRVEIASADARNICDRRFDYILDREQNGDKFYAYVLGINASYLNDDEFNALDAFNSSYNRFFRSAILYSLKKFFPWKQVVVQQIYHEEGQQQNCKYFPWHTISMVNKQESSISFMCNEIIFLPKDHKKDVNSNLIQLCDVFLWACTSILHGIEHTNRSLYRKPLIDKIFPLIKRLIINPDNKNSSYQYINKMCIRFFPKNPSGIGDVERYKNQFYTNRPLSYPDPQNPYTQESLF